MQITRKKKCCDRFQNVCGYNTPLTLDSWNEPSPGPGLHRRTSAHWRRRQFSWWNHKGLLQANVVKITQSLLNNTPLLPVKKPDDSYCLVHGLNAQVADCPACVPDSHALLAQIPLKAMYLTVLDLCGAFCSIPFSVESWGLFGFTYKKKHHTSYII